MIFSVPISKYQTSKRPSNPNDARDMCERREVKWETPRKSYPALARVLRNFRNYGAWKTNNMFRFRQESVKIRLRVVTVLKSCCSEAIVERVQVKTKLSVAFSGVSKAITSLEAAALTVDTSPFSQALSRPLTPLSTAQDLINFLLFIIVCPRWLQIFGLARFQCAETWRRWRLCPPPHLANWGRFVWHCRKS